MEEEEGKNKKRETEKNSHKIRRRGGRRIRGRKRIRRIRGRRRIRRVEGGGRRREG